MADKVQIELSSEYREHLELLKQVIPSSTGEEIKEDSKIVEALIDSFMAFIQEQASAHEHSEWGWCCGGNKNEKKEEWGCCSK